MEYIVKDNSIIIKTPPCFSLKDTLECGQCFRWTMINENEFKGVAKGKYLGLVSSNNHIYFNNCSEEEFNNIWKDYFDLERNYLQIKNDLSAINENLATASDFAPGIRIIKQDSWEALLSFIISQNNNITRIKGIIDRMCVMFGEKINNDYYSFPTAKVISEQTIESLAPLKAGFRAKYMIDAATKVANGQVDLDAICKMPLSDAEESLKMIKGVGPKVAQCVLLYGMGRLDAFPVDVWIKRAMELVCPNNTVEDFGQYAGIAQQYLFEYTRNMKIK